MTKIFYICLLAILMAANIVHAELLSRGKDILGNNLIYDSDLNITWYDYTESADNWNNQINWASDLTVDFGGNIYDDWRLPTCEGYNCTGSEMWHLYYTELGNKGLYDNNNGCLYSSPWCLINKGDFQNLQPDIYWSGVEYASDPGNGAWSFTFAYGNHNTVFKTVGYYAIAVRPGDVAVVPEPISSILFLTGGATLIGRQYLRRIKA